MKEKEEVLVSISCLTYNHEKFIKEAIESFLMQKTNFKYEILIHDDASTDGIQEIIREYEKKYPDVIKPIYQKENQYSKGKKVSFFNNKRAKGKYIAICEGDDYWTDPYKLQKQIDYMEKNEECGMCFHNVGIYDEQKKEEIGEVRPYKKNQISSTEDIIMGDGGFIGTNSIVYRKKYEENIPEFYYECPVGDYPLQIFHSTKKYAYYIDEKMSNYRVNIGTSWTDKNNSYRKQKDLRIALIKMLREFNKYSDKKYEKIIEKRIERWSYKILKFNQRQEFLSKEEYKEFYSNLYLKSKIELYLRKIFKYKMNIN